MRKYCLLFILSLLGLPAFARQISESEARAIAASKLTNIEARRLKAATDVRNSVDAKTPVYIFNSSNGGFVIVAGDDSMPNMVLAYSETGTLDLNNCPPAMRAWLDEMSAFIAEGDFSKASRSGLDYSNPVSPLVSTKWDQGDPYSMLTPLSESGKHCLTGCLATAMAQVINFWQYPVEGGLCEHSYKWNGETLGVDFRESRYDWANMADLYDSDATEAQKNAVSKLMYDCGVAVNMDYGEDVSNATSLNCALAMTDIFGYSKAIRLRTRDVMSSDEWFSLVKGELDAGRPLIYLGMTESDEGHAFVCDGYDSDGMFHINWGWGGSYDGYYDLDTLDPEGQGAGGAASGKGFSTSQSILTDMRPPQPDDKAAPGWEMALYSYFTEPLDEEGTHFNIQMMLINIGYRPFAGYIGEKLYKDGELVSEDENLSEVDEENAMAPGEVYKMAFKDLEAQAIGDGVWTFDLLVSDFDAPKEQSIVPLFKTTSPTKFEIKDGKLVFDPRPVLLIEGYECEDLDLYVTALDGVRSKFANLTLNILNTSGITYDNGFSIKLIYKNGVMMDMTQRTVQIYEAHKIEPGESVEIECPIYYNVDSEVKLIVEENPAGENESQEAMLKDNEISFVSQDIYHELILADDPEYSESAGKVTFTVPVASCMGNPASQEPDLTYEIERDIVCVVIDPETQKIVAEDTQTYSGRWHEVDELVFAPETVLENGTYIVAFIYESARNVMGQSVNLNLGIEEGIDGLPITISTSAINGIVNDNDDSEAEIYSIGGVRVTDSTSLAPGVYICRKGKAASKIIVK